MGPKNVEIRRSKNVHTTTTINKGRREKPLLGTLQVTWRYITLRGYWFRSCRMERDNSCNRLHLVGTTSFDDNNDDDRRLCFSPFQPIFAQIVIDQDQIFAIQRLVSTISSYLVYTRKVKMIGYL